MPDHRPTTRIAVPALAIVTLVAVAVSQTRARLRRYAIAEHSMQPTLGAGDWVLARRVTGPCCGETSWCSSTPGDRGSNSSSGWLGCRASTSPSPPARSPPTVEPSTPGRRGQPCRTDRGGSDQTRCSSSATTAPPRQATAEPSDRSPSADIGWVIWCRYRPFPLRRVR